MTGLCLENERMQRLEVIGQRVGLVRPVAQLPVAGRHWQTVVQGLAAWRRPVLGKSDNN